jgi:hypothetical protein
VVVDDDILIIVDPATSASRENVPNDWLAS